VRLLQRAGVRRVLGADLDPAAVQRLVGMGGEASSLADIMRQADIVIATTGVRGLIKPETVRPGQIVFALSNPDPEIEPGIALQRGAAVAADGKGINNLLGFPGLFKGALAVRAKRFTDAMLQAAAGAIAGLAPGDDLVPDPLNREVHQAVAAAVSRSSSS
jgi:malate dehydrogenase (oxaloacetate-decarboxylating)